MTPRKPRQSNRDTPLRVLYACAEVFPLLKTGGLADVVGDVELVGEEDRIEVRPLGPLRQVLVVVRVPLLHVGPGEDDGRALEVGTVEVGGEAVDAPRRAEAEKTLTEIVGAPVTVSATMNAE